MLVMNLDWSDLRALNGSQAGGFEELCSQLARLETPAGAEFIRKGSPDAGVECFCRLEDGKEWGWQAKFFREPLREPQWKQLDKSVRTALDAHPELACYFVCVPRDRSDGRRPRVTTEMQRWEDRVAKWKEWAREREMVVDFVWWGLSELSDLLSQERQAGRCRYWFSDVKQFSGEWFNRQLERAIEVAGPRYTPAIHVDVPIVEDFNLFGRLEPAVAAVRGLANDIQRKPIYTLRRLTNENSSDAIPELQEVDGLISQVVEKLSGMTCSPHEEWPLSGVVSDIRKALECLDECDDLLAAAADTHNKSDKVEDGSQANQSNPYNRAIRQVYVLENALYNTLDKIGKLDRIVNSDLMIVKGEAGVGKTHLLCDVARRRLTDECPTVLLMGQQFTTRDSPWIQARAQLDFGEQFVGALEAAAQTADRRAVFMIDAINEGEGYNIWPQHLADLLARLRASPWIGVVFSVRTPYIDSIVPQKVRESAYEVTHRGFQDDTYAAVERFCEYYELDFPAMPLLRPEFDNPLFLKILCEGLRHCQQRRIPAGSEGISKVFMSYLDTIDKKLVQELDYDPQGQIVARALGAVASTMATWRTRSLPRQTAQELVNDLVPTSGFSHSLYRAFVDNGLLMEIRTYSCNEWIVQFGYEWFADHLIAKHFVNYYEDPDSLIAALAGGYADNVGTRTWWNALLEALSILLPEKFDVELPRVLTNHNAEPRVRHAFLKSLPWRDPAKIGSDCHKLISELLVEVQHLDAANIGDHVDNVPHSNTVGVFDALVTCATISDHPLDAEFLNRRLRSFKMPDRDAIWSKYLHLAYGEGGPVDRLLDWTEKHLKHTTAPDRKTVEACAAVLAWFLTASHRFVRDRATKALVTLLTNEVGLTCELVRRFNDVDDLYVRERVMAVAYGVAMRNTDARTLAPLADLVYRSVFAHGEPPVHILLRDYARGVIERALHLGVDIDVDEKLVEPPYHSEWPYIPEASELEEFNLLEQDSRVRLSNAEVEQASIYSSVMTGDFARYVIGTNSSSNDWLSVLNTEPLWHSTKEPRDLRVPRLGFDIIQCYVLWRVFDLGWTSERFGVLDRYISSSERSIASSFGHKPERVGKKYQWIAYHEILAYISDRYQYWSLYDDVESRNKYCGAWQLLLVRDIDPSVVFTGVPSDRGLSEDSVKWWSHDMKVASVDEESHKQWLQRESGIPNHELLLRFTNPEDDSTWIKLQGIDIWRSQNEPGYDDHEVERRQIWLGTWGYLTRANEAGEFIEWSETVDFQGRWMPESPGSLELFFGELGWSFAFKTLLSVLMESQHPSPRNGMNSMECPTPLWSTALQYSAEDSTYDCSVANSYNLYRPSPHLVETMNLCWTGQGADFVDDSGVLVAFDPSAHVACSSALLVREENLRRFLSNTGLALVWAVLGEKIALGPGFLAKPKGWLQIMGAGVYKPDEGLTSYINSCLKLPDNDR